MSDLTVRLRQLSAQENCDGEPYDSMMEAADRIEELETQQQWISVKDRLPPVHDHVLTWDGQTMYIEEVTHLMLAYAVGEEYSVLPPMTHWQPLPEPPKGK